jgi:cell wall assembly regulator SMI1
LGPFGRQNWLMDPPVEQSWRQISTWLMRHAPQTAAQVRPPASAEAIELVQRHIPVALPADVRAWWAACDGFTSGMTLELIPRIHVPLPTSDVLDERRDTLALWTDDGGGNEADGRAGAFSHTYQDVFVPVAVDHCGQHLFVDLRDGPLHGCINEWDHEQGFLNLPIWFSVAGMLADVASSLHSGAPARLDYARRLAAARHFSAVSCVPSVTPEGALEWLDPAAP